MRTAALLITLVALSLPALAQEPASVSSRPLSVTDGPWDDKLVNAPGAPLTFELRTDLKDGQLGSHVSRYGLLNRSSKTVGSYRLGCALVEHGTVRPILDAPAPPAPEDG